MRTSRDRDMSNPMDRLNRSGDLEFEVFNAKFWRERMTGELLNGLATAHNGRTAARGKGHRRNKEKFSSGDSSGGGGSFYLSQEQSMAHNNQRTGRRQRTRKLQTIVDR